MEERERREIVKEIKELCEEMKTSSLWRLLSISSFFQDPFLFRYNDISLAFEGLIPITITINVPTGVTCASSYHQTMNWIQTININGRYEELKRTIQKLKQAIEQEKLVFSSHFDSPTPMKEGIEILYSAIEKMETLHKRLLPDLKKLVPLALTILRVKDQLRLKTNIKDLVINIEMDNGEPYPIRIEIPSTGISFAGFLDCCNRKLSFNDPSTWHLTFPILFPSRFKNFQDFKYTYRKMALFRKHLKKGTLKILFSKTLVPLREVETLMAI